MKPRLQAARRRTEKTLPASWPTSAPPFGPPIRLLHTIADHGLFPKMILAHRLPKTEAREISGLKLRAEKRKTEMGFVSQQEKQNRARQQAELLANRARQQAETHARKQEL